MSIARRWPSGLHLPDSSEAWWAAVVVRQPVGGAAARVMVDDFIVDATAMALQNLSTHGTPLPQAQCQSCIRLALAAGLTGIPRDLCGATQSPASPGVS